jgi:hypothetical protein
VCNHAPPLDSNGKAVAVSLPASAIGPTQQQAVDTAVANGVNNQNLVACVAMDYVVSPRVNGGKPFTRFLIFGPSGELLPSVNLDGRGEKFVPGACVACHGAIAMQGNTRPTAAVRRISVHIFFPMMPGTSPFQAKPA